MSEIDTVVYYPVFIAPNMTILDDFPVYIPDFNIYTEGYSIDNAINMAKDAIINALFENRTFVNPSDAAQAYKKAIEDADGIFDFSKDGILAFVKVGISDFMKSHFESEVRKSEDKKMEEELRFIDDKLFVYTPLPQYDQGIYKTQLVMTKEMFQECYKKWIDPQEATGHWIKFKVGTQHKIKCSKCDYIESEYASHIRNYCPNCGRKMGDFIISLDKED